MRPKDSTTDIIRLTNNLRNYLSYSTDKEEQLEYLDEYTEFISEFLTEFRNDRVYVTDMPVARIPHPEGWRRLMVDLDPNLVDTPYDRMVHHMTQYIHSFEVLKDSVIRELSLNREVFIYNIYPFRHMDADGEIRYRPIIRWSRLPLEMWYNDVPPTDPVMVIKKIKKHKL
jgi:hypothetical protein